MDNLNLNDLISGLKAEDIESLKSVAAEIIGNSGDKSQDLPLSEQNPLGLDVSAFSKLTSIMGGLNGKKDSRCDLIRAIKPMLSENRRHKADEAMKMLQLLSMIPMLREQGML